MSDIKKVDSSVPDDAHHQLGVLEANDGMPTDPATTGAVGGFKGFYRKAVVQVGRSAS
jgi:hypothetical protein